MCNVPGEDSGVERRHPLAVLAVEVDVGSLGEDAARLDAAKVGGQVQRCSPFNVGLQKTTDISN
jgi:hypothetical protein